LADAPGKKAAVVAVRDLPDRGRALCHGFIESVTYVPASQVASFIAIVIDHDAPAPVSRGLPLGGKGGPRAGAAGSPPANALPANTLPTPRVNPGAQRQRPAGPKERLRVVWLGRRRIPGVDAGTELRLEGMVTIRDGLRTIFNPRYEILSRQEEQ
jgi:CBS domain-containing protein